MFKYFVLVANLIAVNLMAQSPLVTEVEIIGGPSLSSYWGSDGPRDQVAYLTYSFGGGVSHRFKNKFEINVRFLYERKGNKMDYTVTLYDENDLPGEYRIVQGAKLDYLTLHSILKYYVDKKDRFYTGLGGYVSSLRKSATYSETRSLDTGVTSYYYGSADMYDGFDFGLSASTGYRIPLLPNLILNTQLVSSVGLLNIVDNDLPIEGSSKCFNLFLSVGISIKP